MLGARGLGSATELDTLCCVAFHGSLSFSALRTTLSERQPNEPDALVQPHKPTQESPAPPDRGAGLGDAQVFAQSADSVTLFMLTSTLACTAPGVLRGP